MYIARDPITRLGPALFVRVSLVREHSLKLNQSNSITLGMVKSGVRVPGLPQDVFNDFVVAAVVIFVVIVAVLVVVVAAVDSN